MQRRNLFTYVGACLAGFLTWAIPKPEAKAEMIQGEVLELKAYERPKLEMRWIITNQAYCDPGDMQETVLQYKFDDETEWQEVKFHNHIVV